MPVQRISSGSELEKIAPIRGRHLGCTRPAHATVVAQFVDPRMKIEIEATARGTC